MQYRPFFISRAEVRKLHKLAYNAQQADHLEVCGVLSFDERRRIELWFFDNILKEPYKYEISVKAIRAVREKIRSQKKKILGTFHSHPISEANPSPADITRGFYKRIELIYDVCGKELKLWTIKRRAGQWIVIELPLIIEKYPKRPYLQRTK